MIELAALQSAIQKGDMDRLDFPENCLDVVAQFMIGLVIINEMDIDEEERKRLMYERYPEQIPIATGGSTNFADGGTTGYQGGRNIYSNYDPIMNMNYNPMQNSYPTTTRQTRRITPGFMAGFSPENRYFKGNDPKSYLTRYAGDIEDSSNPQMESYSYSIPSQNYSMPSQNYRGFRPQRLQPLSPPSRFMPPPTFGGYGNPFMQAPSYRKILSIQC